MTLRGVIGKKLAIACVLGALGTNASLATAAGEFDPADNADVRKMVDELSQQGYTRSTLNAIMAKASHQQSIINAMNRPAERHLRWDEYRNIFIQPKRARLGAEFIRTHREAMDKAEREYGVPPEIIAAIIGVETNYGGNKGSYRVLDALSTLAFDYPKRATFFRKELISYLQITLAQGLDPAEMKGSYAGAMGYPQFMPSSYQAYAVDFNGDGIKDLWDEPEDAIGSVANYFAKHHWRKGAPIYVEANGPADKPENIDFNNVRNGGLNTSIQALESAGVTAAGNLPSDAMVLPMALDFEDGHYRYVLGMHNFYVITRYNHSHMYGMAVATLAEQIKAVLAQES
ncbi:lytic murein transglycosylase B [Larsenimonas suaedae]|uniref:Lytic murein transglycosylase B n=1 Tax=Larsenimonas suaedae TaxID=1851019 RepID=A0ABU1GVV9_9GAMM|nr:lytic murein transglycosylase B [Larsenimonas suaedae]MCM2971251.1 lytic murein transglycosylase B [Larsenimonas suaedae]MDR5895960.1 lytic murein transglycosylase B [Larsenimonas suaedae]